jgi:eukaryotic-like serine/threonine-protein kinase
VTPERWVQIEELFHHACECDSKDRDAFLDEACWDDPELRREVEALLASEEHASDQLHAAVREQLETVGFPLVGETISHYRILDGVAGGGMGLVYRAEDTKLGRWVALKFLPEGSAKDGEALGRFEREARAASALEHPNICPIYEFGEHQGQPFLVMQLLEGQTLRDMLSAASPGKPPLALSNLLDLAMQITAGLEAAHQKGIIHRDIKPANLFVTAQGQAKILDFGLAKLASLATAPRDLQVLFHSDDNEGAQIATERIAPMATPDAFLSLTGVAMGTAGYMSPEQVRGEKLDARTDLFSFGLVLYEMATGHRAFKGDTEPSLEKAILNETPASVRELNPKIPPKLEKIIDRALIKDREGRYQSASELHADLEALRREIDWKPSVGWRAMAAGVGALFLIVSMVFWFRRNRPSASQTFPDLKLQQLTINSSENPVAGGAISPDGKYLAYSDRKGVHVKLVGSEEAQFLPQPEGLTNDRVVWEFPSTPWFPDSKRFLVNAHPGTRSPLAGTSPASSAWIFSVLGDTPRKIRDRAFAWSVSLDGSSIAFGTNNGKLGPRELWLMGPNGENAHKLYEMEDEGAICCLYYFSDRVHVSYVTTNQSGDTLVLRDLKGGPVTTLLPPSVMKKVGGFSWLPNGKLIYSDPCNVFTMRFDTPCNYSVIRLDTVSGEVIEKPRQLTNWAGMALDSSSTSADGKRLAFLRASTYGTTYLADLESAGTSIRNARHFTLSEGDEAINDWTSDGKTAIIIRNRADHYAIFKQSVTTDTPEPIVAQADGGLIEYAALSPDSKWILLQVFPIPPVGDTWQQKGIWRVAVDGGSPEYLFNVPPGSGFACARFSSNVCLLAEPTADRKQFIVSTFDTDNGKRGHELFRYDRYLNPNEDSGPIGFAISPNGESIATSVGPEGPIRILSLHGQATRIIRIKNLNLGPMGWMPDGKALLLTNFATDGTMVLYVDLQGNTKLLWNCESPGMCFATASPDGHHLAVYQSKQSSNIWMMENF